MIEKSITYREYCNEYKSDKRIKGGKKGKCALCEKEKTLRMSHVEPKWCLKWAKQEDKGKLIVINRSLGITTIEQDGSKHYMLCDDCEQFLGEAENYIKTLMHGTIQEQAKKGIRKGESFFLNTNLELIQRFMFGLTLKSHFATSAPFHNFTISNKLVDELRNRIFNPIVNDDHYPIFTTGFYSKKIKDGDPKAMMFPGIEKSQGKDVSASFLLAGWEWVLCFHNKEFYKYDKNTYYLIKKIRLRKEGFLYVPWIDITEHRNFLHLNDNQ
jgi:hypothetical protein